MKHTDKIMRNKFLQPLAAFVLIFLVLSAITLSGCNGEKKQVVENTRKYVIPDTLMSTLQLDTVKTIPLVNSITFTGMVDVNQDNQVSIFPLVSGNATDIRVQLGDYVTAGQALATIKSSEMAGYSNNLTVCHCYKKAA
jgi:cobalt-zinc-cadmium efflux system membrane fusion protein